MNKRLGAISQLIKPQSVVADIGSDHAFLAIDLLTKREAQHVYNIEINALPYKNTINNLQKHALLDRTTNILGNGLQTNAITQLIDVCVISGMGGLNMIKILSEANPTIKIKQFILMPNNNVIRLRAYLVQNGYKVIYEENIIDRKRSYPLMQIIPIQI
ncbi:MAG: class I SAM-dependent methyltransferase [Mycoplasmataceae bacterium]|jgi:tRNA (adenine22-N1)-methyltransferase|nr:class I SAM-dependent methyltransferase [Mycoplasmataceae bacterium]